jgi:hypothetical protein
VGWRSAGRGGGGHLLIRDHDAGRGVDVLHGEMKWHFGGFAV